MQLPAENGAAVSLDGEGGVDSGASPQHQASGGVGSRVLSSGGKAPGVTTTSPTSSTPSSPGSPSKSVGGAAGPREKPVKVLPCPRCESLNTKFCYYNNYSVTQPRHFCRQCQRYWTAGGTLRNVPVGGGSRKKNRHPRGGEPYLQQRTGLPSPTSTFGMPTSGGLQNVGGGHFQQMMAQDVGGFPQLNFGQQVPGGFAYHHPYGNMEPIEMGQQQVMYGAAVPQMHPPPQFFFPQQQQQQQEGGTVPFQNDMTGVVKTEFWPQHGIVPPSPPSGNPGKNGQRFESSMLLNLGLNSRPQQQQQQQQQQLVHPQQQQQQQAQSQQTELKPSAGTSITGTKNGSPPHGSSTIEEEGSTPTNGYSNSGYEEGDAVSSMWPNLHDIDTIFQ